MAVMCFNTSTKLRPATRLSSEGPSRVGLAARLTMPAFTRIPGSVSGGRALITRASDSKAALNAAADAIKDFKDPEKIQARVEEASKTLQQAASNLDISQLVRYNFIAQLFLTLSSYAIMFFTTHATIASGAKPGLGTIILIVGTLLTGYSTFLSYGYFSQVKSGGEAVLAGWERLAKFYSHITVNFIGAATGVLALQATVGSQVMGTLANNALTAVHLSKATAEGTNLGLQFLMQAASNILLAHIVSIFFLVLLLKKTTDAYEALIGVAEKFKAAMAF